MANIGFTNTKVALAFAGMTILGTLLIIGTPDNEGVLGQITNRFSEQPDAAKGENDTVAAEQSVSTVANAPKPDWANPVTEVSDNDDSLEGSAMEAPTPPFTAPTPPFTAPPPPFSGDPAKAPLSPNVIVSDDDDEK